MTTQTEMKIRSLAPWFGGKHLEGSTKNLAQQNKRGVDGRTEAPEVLLINGPSLVEAL